MHSWNEWIDFSKLSRRVTYRVCFSIMPNISSYEKKHKYVIAQFGSSWFSCDISQPQSRFLVVIFGLLGFWGYFSSIILISWELHMARLFLQIFSTFLLATVSFIFGHTMSSEFLLLFGLPRSSKHAYIRFSYSTFGLPIYLAHEVLGSH